MTQSSKTWQATTRTWSVSRGTPGQSDAITTARPAATDSLIGISEKWRYETDDEDGPFSVEINNGAVTVNGRHYDSLDAVPRAERERIEAVRESLSGDGLVNLLRQAGVDARVVTGTAGRHASARPEFVMETESPDVRDAATTGQAAPPSAARDTDAAAPGAVPQSGSLRRIVLVAVALGLAWAGLRLTGAI